MPTTTVLDGDGTDWTAAVRALGARTDNAGTAVTDLAADEDRLINHILTEGFLTTGAFKVTDGASGMQVDVGSGTAKADIYVVEGDDVGQHPYLVRMDDATVTITLDAGDADPRIDEIYLVVRDATYDGGTVTEAQLGYRKGDAAATPSAPGPDPSWDAEVLLATIDVAASASTVAAGDITDNRAASGLVDALQSTIDHGSMSGLGDDDHSIYAKHAGTNPPFIVGDSHGSVAPAAQDDIVIADGVPTLAFWDAVAGTFVRLVWDNGRFEFDKTTVVNNAGTAVAMDAQDDLGIVDGAPQIALYSTSAAKFMRLLWNGTKLTANGKIWHEEVDNSTEVASQPVTGTAANLASVSLSIPSDWASWRCEAYATFVLDSGGVTGTQFSFTIQIDGTSQQSLIFSSSSDLDLPASVGGRRTGMTTTGSRTVSLRGARVTGATNVNADDIYLYARAVRTG